MGEDGPRGPGESVHDAKLDRLWDKKFKLRIRSKNTGKEIDINFRFNLGVKDPKEDPKVKPVQG